MSAINTAVEEEDYGITFDGVSDDDLGAIETLKQIKDLVRATFHHIVTC